MVEDVLKVHGKSQIISLTGFRSITSQTTAAPTTATTRGAAATASAAGASASARESKAAASAAFSTSGASSAIAAWLRSCALSFAAESKRLTDSQISTQRTRALAIVAGNNYFAGGWIWIECAKTSYNYARFCQVTRERRPLRKYGVAV
jgi:hypothetical protein